MYPLSLTARKTGAFCVNFNVKIIVVANIKVQIEITVAVSAQLSDTAKQRIKNIIADAMLKKHRIKQKDSMLLKSPHFKTVLLMSPYISISDDFSLSAVSKFLILLIFILSPLKLYHMYMDLSISKDKINNTFKLAPYEMLTKS